jgi:hypothetical protein
MENLPKRAYVKKFTIGERWRFNAREAGSRGEGVSGRGNEKNSKFPLKGKGDSELISLCEIASAMEGKLWFSLWGASRSELV